MGLHRPTFAGFCAFELKYPCTPERQIVIGLSEFLDSQIVLPIMCHNELLLLLQAVLIHKSRRRVHST